MFIFSFCLEAKRKTNQKADCEQSAKCRSWLAGARQAGHEVTFKANNQEEKHAKIVYRLWRHKTANAVICVFAYRQKSLSAPKTTVRI